MAESAEGFVNGVQIIGDVCPLGVVSTGALNDHMPRSKMATGCFTIRGTGALFKERGSDGSNARGTGMEKMLGELMAVTCQCSQVVCKILLKMVCCCLPCLDPEQRFVGLMGCLSTRS
ncbi:uncharacterized protein LOC144011524 isoform X5 [Festucalex cinctus]